MRAKKVISLTKFPTNREWFHDEILNHAREKAIKSSINLKYCCSLFVSDDGNVYLKDGKIIIKDLNK